MHRNESKYEISLEKEQDFPLYFHLYLKNGHFFHIPQFLRKKFFYLFLKLNIKMSYIYRNFVTKINCKKAFLKSFLINPLIAFNKERTV